MPTIENDDLYSATYGTYSLTASDGAIVSSCGCFLSMDLLPINGLSLQYTFEPVNPSVQLNMQGVTQAAGPPGMGASLNVGPTGITLQFGPPGAGASIKLDATGITLQAGPMTKIQLTPAGLTMQGLVTQLTANTSLTVTAGLLSETASGAVSRSALSTAMM